MKEYISLAHGNGGRLMRELIDDIFVHQLGDLLIDTESDAVALDFEHANNEIMFTTDGFTVYPLEFPGGDIGSLAIHGTVNDLCVAGATPCYLSLNAFIEEGMHVEQLSRIIHSMANAARHAGIRIAAGDTKVLRRGEGSGLYLATTGIGIKPRQLQPGMSQIQDGDTVLVSGPVGDHGVAVMLAREQFGLRGDILSDSANVIELTRAMLGIKGLRFMRDPTRGGLATVLNEISRCCGLGVRVDETHIPVREAVKSVCDILGYDPYYLASEGRVLAVVDSEYREEALACWQSLPQGKQAAIIGEVTSANPRVVLTTELGGERILQELEDDPLPRIC